MTAGENVVSGATPPLGAALIVGVSVAPAASSGLGPPTTAYRSSPTTTSATMVALPNTYFIARDMGYLHPAASRADDAPRDASAFLRLPGGKHPMRPRCRGRSPLYEWHSPPAQAHAPRRSGLGPLRRGRAQHGREAALHVLLGGRPAGDADAHRRAALPHGHAGPAGAVLLDGGDRRAASSRRRRTTPAPGSAPRRSGSRSRRPPGPRRTPRAWRQSRSIRSARPRAAQRAQRRPDLHAAGAARELGREVRRARASCSVGQVGGRDRPWPRAARSGSRTKARPLS